MKQVLWKYPLKKFWGEFQERSLPGVNLKLETFVSNYWNIFLEPMGSAFMDSLKVSVSDLAESLAQMLRLEGSGLKFCK